MNETERAPFAAWLYADHGKRDPISELAAAIRDDANEPDPADLDELRCYLVSVGASAETHRAAVEAWAVYQAEQHADFARAVAEYAEQWQERDDDPITLPIAGLLAELEYDDDAATVEAARRLLCDLAPWLVGAHQTIVRVEDGTATLDYGGAARLTADPRYNLEARQ